METLKNLYNRLNQKENKNIKNTVIFSFFIGLIVILGAIYVFWNLRKSRERFIDNPVPRKSVPVFRRPVMRQPINKSPEKRGRYLIRKKPGYIEQSPKKKTYPSKFKISSILD